MKIDRFKVKLPKQKLTLSLIFLISTITAFIFPLLKFPKEFIGRDWGLFDSFSLFSNSSWNYYKIFPLHNPYVLGGMDNLANPQTKVCSPLMVFDVFFSGPMANLLSLVTLGFIGSFGFFHLLRYLNVNRTISIIIAILFIHSSWFHLHFSEGHIIFGSFMLFGYALLFILRIEESKYKILYAILCAFYILDGGIYAFVYTQLILLFSLLFKLNGISFIRLIKSILENKWNAVFSIFLFISLSAIKLFPLLLLQADRIPIIENLSLDINTILNSFFNPLAFIFLKISGGKYIGSIGFHEIGAYIGILSILIITFFIYKKKDLVYLPYLMIIIFFFWVGTGWLDPINPWRIFQKIPFFNNAHIQSRSFIVVDCFLFVLLGFALNYIKDNKLKLFPLLSVLLIVESLLVSFYPYYKVYQYKFDIVKINESPNRIENSTIETTYFSPNGKYWGFAFQHFFRKNAATKTFMDPSSKTFVKSNDDPNYKGEIYLLKGEGNASILKYTPRELIVHYDVKQNSEIQVNTNFLLGWRSSEKSIPAYSKKGLLTFHPKNKKGDISFKYRPKFYYFRVYLFITGLLSLLLYIVFGEKISNYFR
jgi:hypothetical protein